MTTTLDALGRSLPAPVRGVAGASVAVTDEASTHRWVVLDDDPTGTQSVRDLPVLTSWSPDDFRWAFSTQCPAVYVQTNARSLDPESAAEVMSEVVRAAVRTAAAEGLLLEFVSRTDSTLRGHFPLDTDVIRRVLVEEGGEEAAPDVVLLVPGFPDAGRVTVQGVHYVCSPDGTAVPAADSPFAQDATFGYASSDLRAWVEDKTAGATSASEVFLLALTVIREGVDAVVKKLDAVGSGTYVVVDALAEEDMQVVAEAVRRLRSAGAAFVHRVGPPFVRSLIGQSRTAPLTRDELVAVLGERNEGAAVGGLVIVGSHVPTTTRQLTALEGGTEVSRVELDVRTLLGDDSENAVRRVASEVADLLRRGTVVVSTSRELVAGADERDSLRIARRVSDSLVALTRHTLQVCPPRFIIAKGGITSSDLATRALEIRRGMVRGQMQQGIISMWESIDGPAQGVPYIVFAGNVGDDDSLRTVVQRLIEVDVAADSSVPRRRMSLTDGNVDGSDGTAACR